MDSQKIKSLQSYLVRLHQGEDLASVRREFEKDFASVSTEDIMEAEQDLLQAGKLSENMGHLCDLHSCLLHGKMETMGEQFPEGHPLQLFLKENEAIESHLDRLSAVMNGPFLAADVLSVLEGLLPVKAHYDKKDEVLLPILSRKGMPGPSRVMWNADGEIRNNLQELIKMLKKEDPHAEKSDDETLHQALSGLLNRMREMIFKETEILVPMVQKLVDQNEWPLIAGDFPRFGWAYLTDVPTWNSESLTKSTLNQGLKDRCGTISLPSGELTVTQLEGILRTLPFELTFVDAADTNRFFSESTPLFPRPLTALGHSVYDCHPPKVVPMVKGLIEKLRSGEKDSLGFETVKKGKKPVSAILLYGTAKGPIWEHLKSWKNFPDGTKKTGVLMGTRLYYVQLFDKKVINIDFLIHKLGADKKILRLFQGLNGFRRNFHAEIIETVHGVNGFFIKSGRFDGSCQGFFLMIFHVGQGLLLDG
jgi:hypothetical protein